MLVVGAVFQIAAFLIQFFAPPFPHFSSSFALAGIGSVLQVGIDIIYIHKELPLITSLLTLSSLHPRMASSQLFNRTLSTNRVLYKLHLVQSFPSNPTLT